MDKLLLSLIEKGGALGVIVAVVIILVVVGVWLRQKGVLALGDSTKVVRRDELSQIVHRVSSIDQSIKTVDKRLSQVENDLEGRPSRAEFHELEKGFVRLEGRVERTLVEISATRAAVTRIEEHMYKVAENMAGRVRAK